jgi:beta-lactamase superfamily II metal-dependent hydrolase
MSRPRVTVLDVGHGVCAVLQDEVGTVMFDVPYGDVPRSFLRGEHICVLDAVFISHHHKDHCAGMTGFLGNDYDVRHVFFNAPRKSETKTFDRMLVALREARTTSAHRPHPRVLQFASDIEARVLDRGEVRITILGPDSVDLHTETEMYGARRIQTEHSLCGVARIDHVGRPRLLLTGDLNDRGLAALRAADADALRADVLVYPHHGGASDVRDERAFAQELATLVKPRLVVFSLARDSGERPHPEVIEGLRAATSDAHVVCTQLSMRCHKGDQMPSRQALHLAPAAGERANHCCGGSLRINLDQDSPAFVGADDHASFVDSHVEAPLCRFQWQRLADVAI